MMYARNTIAAPTCSVDRLGSAKRRLKPLRNTRKKSAIRVTMPAAPSTAARHGSRPRKANRPSARMMSRELPPAMRKRPRRCDWRSSAGKSVKRSDRVSGSSSGPDSTSLIAPPSVRSVFYRHRVERAPQVPGGDRAPRAPAVAQLAHPAERDLPALEVGHADALLQAEVVEREHVGTQQVEHQEHLRGPAPDSAHVGELGDDLLVRHPRPVARVDLAVDEV